MITVASIMRNEADRLLTKVLPVWQQFADRIVVLDDGSTDETAAICRDHGCEVHEQPPTMFKNEWVARKALWELVQDSEWVLHLDADQIPAGDPRKYYEGQPAPLILYPLYDMWSETHYRSDPWWQGHTKAWWASVHVPSFKGHPHEWNKRGWHSGHIPSNLGGPVFRMPREKSILHYAYYTPELRQQKAEMYGQLGEVLSEKERFHAATILKDCKTIPLPFQPEYSL